MAKAATGADSDLGKCSTKFAEAFGKAEAKGGCLTSDDSGAIEGRIDAATDGIGLALSGARFVDNGDGQ
jgi:hypothetical protein